MNAKAMLEVVTFFQLFICLGLSALLIWRRSALRFWPLTTFVAVRLLLCAIDIPLMYFRKDLGISKVFAYKVLFYTNWPCVFLEAAIMIVLVYTVYSMVLAPFEPLRKLGTLMFRWVGAVSLVIALALSIAPKMFGWAHALSVIGQLQETTAIFTLCLLLFVCFTMRPLGLSNRSRNFGVCVGLGVAASVQLFQAAWISSPSVQSVYSVVYFWSGLGCCATLLVWTVYFALPEPAPRMILLPTTSPYFSWNRISEILGADPGLVAISGVTPDMLAPAELEALRAFSDKPEHRAPRILKTALSGK